VTDGRPYDPVWGSDDGAFRSIARNVVTRYVAFGVDAMLGLLMLPFNLEHLGKPLYGLWILIAALTTSFALLDVGYGGALVRFVARYRSSRDRTGLNQILSTLFVIYSVVGLTVVAISLLLVQHVDRIFTIDAGHVPIARQVLLIISAFVGIRFACSVFGGVVVGFQQYHRNNITSIVTSIAVAAVNVAVLKAGFGLVELVVAVTCVRLLGLLSLRRNAYRAFPGLRIRLADFSMARLREVSGFSVYMLLLDLGYKLNYSSDTLVLGAFLNTSAVALWAPAQRLTELLTRLTNQLNDALFPYVVDIDAARRTARLRETFIHATRLSLATVLPLAGGVAMMAHPLVERWIGPSFSQTASILQVLTALAVLRVGTATSNTILKGAGEHQRLATYVGLTGLANIVLSIALVKPYGLIGVAIGTVVPVTLMALFVNFPRACRRVGVTPFHALRQAVWPAVWPAFVMVLFLGFARPVGSVSLAAVGIKVILGALIYEAVFLGIAIGGAERRRYLGKARELIPSRLTYPSRARGAATRA
jgi:O-antigen/teichoic acid export membrane protein